MMPTGTPTRIQTAFSIFLILCVCHLLYYTSTLYRGGTGKENNFEQPMMEYTLDRTMSREKLAYTLEKRGYTHGVELGVQKGIFSEQILSIWGTCLRYVLVDIWQKQTNYLSSDNVEDHIQESLYKGTLKRLTKYSGKIEICKNFTTVCAQRFAENSFDFIYVDARHEYKALNEDIMYWFAKLRPGGILAGHDYLIPDDRTGPRRWDVNDDGSVDTTGRAGLGAINDYFGMHRDGYVLQIIDPGTPHKTWVIDTMTKYRKDTMVPLVFHLTVSKYNFKKHEPVSNQMMKHVELWMSTNPNWFFVQWTEKLILERFADQAEHLRIYKTATSSNEAIRLGILYRYGGINLNTKIRPHSVEKSGFFKSCNKVGTGSDTGSRQQVGVQCSTNAVIGYSRNHPMLQKKYSALLWQYHDMSWKSGL